MKYQKSAIRQRIEAILDEKPSRCFIGATSKKHDKYRMKLLYKANKQISAGMRYEINALPLVIGMRFTNVHVPGKDYLAIKIYFSAKPKMIAIEIK